MVGGLGGCPGGGGARVARIGLSNLPRHNRHNNHPNAAQPQEAYIAIDKGAITPDHVLVVPIDHFPSCASLKPGPWEEVGSRAG